MNKFAFTNTKLKKIVNVYQLNYKNGKSFGLGDFIRGCFFLNQLCYILQIEFDLDISKHPMSKFIENCTKNFDIDYDSITIDQTLKLNTRDEIHKYAENLIQQLNNHNSEIYYLCTNEFPFCDNVKHNAIQKIKSNLIPNNTMNNYIDETLYNLKLKKNEYVTIHIRTGDKYLTTNELHNKADIKNIINFLITNTNKNKKYLIISDSNKLKYHLRIFFNFYMTFNQIEHLGGEFSPSEENDGVKNTLLDFYLMSYSNAVISLSCYSHGSGFSKWCAKIHNIPYICYKINI